MASATAVRFGRRSDDYGKDYGKECEINYFERDAQRIFVTKKKINKISAQSARRYK